MRELPQDDIDFLSKLGSQLPRNEIADEALAGLRQAAATGNPTAVSLLRVVEAAEVTQHLVNSELKETMFQAATMIKLQSPLLATMTSANGQFLEELARVLDGVMRDAFARGWLAHKAETNAPPPSSGR